MRFGRKKTLTERAQEYVESVAKSAKPHLETAVDTAATTARDAADRAGPVLRDARERAVPALQDARERAVPVLQDARERAVPLAHEARDKAAPYVAEGRARAERAASAGAALAAERANAGREAAAARLAEAQQQVEPDPEPRKGGKLKKLVLLGGLAALGAVVWSKFGGQSATNNWQTSYVPNPAPTGGTTAGAGTATTSDDPAGAAPGEALTDSTEEPQPTSTPEDPAEVVDIDGSDSSRS